ncbi:MAG: hypothetical protein U1G08_16845 [Verrucomicrobiota bacterium]
MKELSESWERLLNPESLKRNLVAAAVFLAAYEMLKDSMIDRLRDFFSDDIMAESGSVTSPDYRVKVLSLHKKEMVACSLWFRNMGALAEDDLKTLGEIAQHRNFVAHQLPNVLGESGKDVSLERLAQILELTSKVDRWWIREVEVPTNPDFDVNPPSPEDLEQSFSSRMMIMALLIEVAGGDDSRLADLYSGAKAAFASRREEQLRSPKREGDAA